MLEFKVNDSPEHAIRQIREKKYALKFLKKGRKKRERETKSPCSWYSL